MLRYGLLVVMGLISVIASELLSIGALANAPVATDLTDDFFVSLVLPSVIVVTVLNALLLWKVFAQLNWRGIGTFTAVYSIAYGTVLTTLRNPVPDVATYVAIVLVATPIVLGTFNKTFWARS